jgi:hypothetical protein
MAGAFRPIRSHLAGATCAIARATSTETFMRTPSLIVFNTVATLVVIAAAPAAARAQHSGAASALVTKAPKEASQYEFLLGTWSLTVKPLAVGLGQKIHGVPKLGGTWKAWRALDGWGVEDELRIVDASGNPMALSLFVRVYDAAARHWVVTGIDAYHGKATSSVAEWKDGGMFATAEGTDADGKPFLSRVRIAGITPTAFKYTQDRSFDGGKTWEEGFLTIDAKRTAAAAER